MRTRIRTDRRTAMLMALAVVACSLAQPARIAAQGAGFHGYRIARYKGEVVNTTANAKGNVVLEIKSVDRASGDVTAYFLATMGVYGESDLSGKIDETGILRLSGKLSTYEMTVVGRVNGDTIRAGYRLTGRNDVQEGTFTAAGRFSDEDLDARLLPKDDEAQQAFAGSRTKPVEAGAANNTTRSETTGRKSAPTEKAAAATIKKGRPAGGLTEEIVKRTIVEYEKSILNKGSSIVDGSVIFESLQFGQAQRPSSVDPLLGKTKMFYPVRAKYKLTRRDEYKYPTTYYEEKVKEVYLNFDFYINSFDEWQLRWSSIE